MDSDGAEILTNWNQQHDSAVGYFLCGSSKWDEVTLYGKKTSKKDYKSKCPKGQGTLIQKKIKQLFQFNLVTL